MKILTDIPCRLKNNRNLSFRSESIDSTTVIYCSNGYDAPVSGKVKFNLQNAVTSRGSEIDVEIPPLTEIYICLVNPRDISKSFAFSYTISYRVME